MRHDPIPGKKGEYAAEKPGDEQKKESRSTMRSMLGLVTEALLTVAPLVPLAWAGAKLGALAGAFWGRARTSAKVGALIYVFAGTISIGMLMHSTQFLADRGIDPANMDRRPLQATLQTPMCKAR